MSPSQQLPVRRRATSLWSALGRGCRFAVWYVKEVVGENDYEHYLKHLQRHHPDARPVPRKAFERDKVQRLETNPKSRCC
ncbi:YbdD/YjiX family protein [Planosporangium mesophilum]|uniref:YbdD/YjiX family protein n=1 Tax=Planosporangium mesophilum TaxID=689768 RepID=A0A8J3TA37_9ACTN|nr:YbdD/YjiX family protein [Planosporangium mesophilum]NJC83945.1 YbdD/YjiX family protein [Planosporangium mesophilum]GII22688.1 hypothetical protein Pme01_22850 [Planosporangium mesophilum]